MFLGEKSSIKVINHFYNSFSLHYVNVHGALRDIMAHISLVFLIPALKEQSVCT